MGRFLGTRYLSKSKQGARNSRTGLVQKKNEANYLCAFLSTKPHSNLQFNVVECCPLGNLKRILKCHNYIVK